ncbi:MAG TPA: hypothetical protein PKA05_21365 [Roseiflexaceae bacterium]|nr:hypothetical protein [Roseiflexaceae bacterium]HMP42938.1 hypothetical protein [Roseiflexaceae bacterium]
MPGQNERFEYTEIMRALGHFIQQHHLTEVSIVEFDRGWIVAGLTYSTTMEGFIRVPVDFVISQDTLRKMIHELRENRKIESPPRRGWFR